MSSDGSMARLPNFAYGVLWVDGDTGTEHVEFDTMREKSDPADVDTAVYVRVDALLSPDTAKAAGLALARQLAESHESGVFADVYEESSIVIRAAVEALGGQP